MTTRAAALPPRDDGAASPTRPRASARPADAVPTELSVRLRLAVTRLSRHLRQQADAGIRPGITPTQLSALSAVHREGRVTLGDLATRERVQPPTMSRVAADLEAAGLIVREADPGDGRVAWLRLSPDGHRAIHRAHSRKDAYLARRLDALSARERAALEQAVPVLERLMEEGG